ESVAAEEHESLVPIWNAVNEGVDNSSDQFMRAFIEDADNIYPKEQIPPTGHALILYVDSLQMGTNEAIRSSRNPSVESRGEGSVPAAPKEAAPTTEISESPDIAQAAGGTSLDRLHYKGRSFDEWRTQWRNELDVELRVEAIKAIAAFGRAGHGRE